MKVTEDERAYLWVCALSETEPKEKLALLRAASPLDVFRHAEKYLPAGAPCAPLSEREKGVDAFLLSLEKKGYFAVTPLSDDYPEPLKNSSSPPFVLYGAGRRELLRARKFCIVGSRVTPPWAEKLGRSIAEELSERFAIVTGLAEGGDSAAIAGALPSGNLIAVLPCGLDECYPAAHISLKNNIKNSGLLLTELRPEEPARKYSFHARNRILAGLSEGVLVISAGIRSGTLITANCALDCGRDVFAFPHNVGSAYGVGCNELLKRGAFVVTGAEDIFAVYGMTGRKRQEVELTPEEARVLSALRDRGEAHLTLLSEDTGFAVFELSAILSGLEIKGVAVRSGGNKYSAV